MHEVTFTVGGETVAKNITVIPKDFGTVEIEAEPEASEVDVYKRQVAHHNATESAAELGVVRGRCVNEHPGAAN